MTLHDMRIEPCENGHMFVAETDQAYVDKNKIKNILLSVIDNYNKANPDYRIEEIPT